MSLGAGRRKSIISWSGAASRARARSGEWLWSGSLAGARSASGSWARASSQSWSGSRI